MPFGGPAGMMALLLAGLRVPPPGLIIEFRTGDPGPRRNSRSSTFTVPRSPLRIDVRHFE